MKTVRHLDDLTVLYPTNLKITIPTSATKLDISKPVVIEGQTLKLEFSPQNSHDSNTDFLTFKLGESTLGNWERIDRKARFYFLDAKGSEKKETVLTQSADFYLVKVDIIDQDGNLNPDQNQDFVIAAQNGAVLFIIHG